MIIEIPQILLNNIPPTIILLISIYFLILGIWILTTRHLIGLIPLILGIIIFILALSVYGFIEWRIVN